MVNRLVGMVKMTDCMLKAETGKRLEALLLQHVTYALRPKMADEAVKLLTYQGYLVSNGRLK